jgi:hypothetical protein
MAGFPTPFRFCLIYHIVVLQPPLCRNIMGLGCFPFARHYSGNHYCFLFLCLLRCFSSAGLRIYATILQIVRFPHSEIRGSIHICWSPRLIAAYHVLHRLWEPRHPPCTLSYFLLRITLLLVMVCFFYLRVVCLSFHRCIGSLVLLPLYLCSCNPLKPDNVPTVVFSFFQLLLPICQRTLPHTIY